MGLGGPLAEAVIPQEGGYDLSYLFNGLYGIADAVDEELDIGNKDIPLLSEYILHHVHHLVVPVGRGI